MININSNWDTGYRLIDCGDFEKLEQFGDFILCRPEPQAMWKKSLSDNEWDNLADAKFILDTKNSNGEKGFWKKKKSMPEHWILNYPKLNFNINLGFNSFKHIGVFPEQADNWNFIYDSVSNINSSSTKVLNLFAYTGCASVAAAKAGAKVVHVDSVKQVVNRANDNMKINSLDNISWIIDDALKFVKREVKRNAKYNGIILDPPAFGRGPDGEKWILEKNIDELLFLISKLLTETNSFFVINVYSLGFSPYLIYNLLAQYFDKNIFECGETYLKDDYQKILPLGIYLRFRK